MASAGLAENKVVQVGGLAELQAANKSSKRKIIVVDFFATWCGPCVAAAPKFQELANANQDLLFLKVDVDKARDIAQKYGIRAMPTFVVMNDKFEEVQRVTGFSPSSMKSAVEAAGGNLEVPEGLESEWGCVVM